MTANKGPPESHSAPVAIVKQRVRKGPPLGSVEELWERLERTWWDIEPDLCRRLAESMPARVEAVKRGT